MLRTPPPPDTLDTEVQRYLREALGSTPQLTAWAREKKVPYYLQDAFDFRELTLLDRRVLLAIDRRPKSPPPANIREQLNTLQKIADMPIAYVTRALASFERKRLIQQKVPFIVPGNQLYLPSMGLDLREYFRKRSETPAAASFNPSTQALLITALLRTPWEPIWEPAQAAVELSYTAMTVSRALRELTEAGIGEVRRERRTQSLYFSEHPGEIWDRAEPFLRSPVKRIEWAHPASVLHPSQAPLAGTSALAQQTSVADPKWPVRAVTSQRWLAATRAGFGPLPEPTPGAYQWQIWSYDPNLGVARKVVDPLSLALSFRTEKDERIQLALEELKERRPW